MNKAQSPLMTIRILEIKIKNPGRVYVKYLMSTS